MTRRTAIQPDLFAAEEHRAKLDRLGDPLQEVESVIDFAALAAEVEKIAPLKDQPKGGRPPYPIETKGARSGRGQEKTGARGRNERPERGGNRGNSVPNVMKTLFHSKFPGKWGLIEVSKIMEIVGI